MSTNGNIAFKKALKCTNVAEIKEKVLENTGTYLEIDAKSNLKSVRHNACYRIQ
jgi:hypothetical protein